MVKNKYNLSLHIRVENKPKSFIKCLRKPKRPPARVRRPSKKKKEKVIEDKTFGLKNKKGAKQQKFIQQVEKQVKSGGVHPSRPDDKKLSAQAKPKDHKELELLIRPVQTQKIEKGTDPKSVVCTFFKQGQCGKGDRCKFSHDLSIERRAEKRSLYVDVRQDDDNMDSWDDDKLKEVVEKKHGGGGAGGMPTTDIICKHFLEAVESSKYGWFWECPQANRCIYRHALPPGFVLKRDRKREDKKEDISLVDLIERERAALGPHATRVTLHSFLEWKQRKLREKQERSAAAEEQKRSDLRAGRAAGLSGREMFSFDPGLAAAADQRSDDEDETLDYAQYERDEDDDYREIQLDLIALEASEADDSGTKKAAAAATNGDGGGGGAAPINESLFLDEELDDELQRLELE